jgi:tRNA nucleotidyltransferase (CCA-adding enzyme)
VLVDPCHGLEDLAAGRLRAISEANLLDDPLRLLRGVRLGADLDLPIDDESGDWIRQHRARLTEVAPERVLAELERMAKSPSGQRGLALALDFGLLDPWLAPNARLEPGLQLDALTPARARARGLSSEEALAALPVARLALLFDAAGLGRLQASRRLRQRVGCLHDWLGRLQGAAIQGTLDRLPEDERLALQMDLEADLPALLLHLEGGQAQTALARWRDPHDPLFHPAAPVDGNNLRELLQLEAGPLIGHLLHHLKRERAMGRLPAQNPDPDLIRATTQRWLAVQGREVT